MTIVSATKTAALVGYPTTITAAAKAAQNDFIMFTDNAGVLPLSVTIMNNGSLASAPETSWVYNTCQVATTIAATVTTLATKTIVGSSHTDGDYYMYNPNTGEMIYVVSDAMATTDVTGTLTIIRGCLGTTAAALTANEYLMVMNSIKLTGAVAGVAFVQYNELPRLPKASVFG